MTIVIDYMPHSSNDKKNVDHIIELWLYLWGEEQISIFVNLRQQKDFNSYMRSIRSTR